MTRDIWTLECDQRSGRTTCLARVVGARRDSKVETRDSRGKVNGYPCAARRCWAGPPSLGAVSAGHNCPGPRRWKGRCSLLSPGVIFPISLKILAPRCLHVLAYRLLGFSEASLALCRALGRRRLKAAKILVCISCCWRLISSLEAARHNACTARRHTNVPRSSATYHTWSPVEVHPEAAGNQNSEINNFKGVRNEEVTRAVFSWLT